MRRLRFFIGVALALSLVAGARAAVFNGAKKKAREARFTVRIENISSAEGLPASDGTRWPFALSPGMYVVDDKSEFLFEVGKYARANGLQAQAEDGNPEQLIDALERMKHRGAQHGIFNTPVGEAMPGPAGPGGVFEFTFAAEPGQKLSFITMFGQSNDLFYAPAKAIPLFDKQGQPLGGDITAQVMLFDAGTEKNQEPGIGPDQAPRQKAPNTGQFERKKIGPVNDGYSYPATSSVLRVTITPET